MASVIILDENRFRLENDETRPIVNTPILDEIEMSSVAKIFQKDVDELKADPKIFTNIKALRRAEMNAFNLAADYKLKIRKNWVSFNEELNALANRFIQDKAYLELIKTFERNLDMLKNREFVKQLIQVAEDCVRSAYILATHRSATRRNNNTEAIKSSTARIEQCGTRVEQRVVRMENQMLDAHRKLDLLLANNNNRQPLPVQQMQNNQPPQPNILAPIVAAPLPPRQAEQLPAPERVAPPNPSWIISQERARRYIVHENNLKKYLSTLFTACEILLPRSCISKTRNFYVKQKEFKLVYNHFKPEARDWKEKFDHHMKTLNCAKRQAVFNKIHKTHGYGISDAGIDFYYKIPASQEMRCYSDIQCRMALPTREVGNKRIPLICGNFKFIIFIEKLKLRSKISEMRHNGLIYNLQG